MCDRQGSSNHRGPEGDTTGYGSSDVGETRPVQDRGRKSVTYEWTEYETRKVLNFV